jgi:uncharacterized membrane protein YesL
MPSSVFVVYLITSFNIPSPQVLYPSFIAEMKRPQDFPKALAALSIAEFVLFAVPAIVGYRYAGQCGRV